MLLVESLASPLQHLDVIHHTYESGVPIWLEMHPRLGEEGTQFGDAVRDSMGSLLLAEVTLGATLLAF
jgi:hypothetical protein